MPLKVFLLFIVCQSQYLSAFEPVNNTQLEETPTNKIQSWNFLKPYNADYTVIVDGDTLGKSNRSLTVDNGQWKISTKSKIKKWFIKVRNVEYSLFKTINNTLQTNEFFTQTKVSFKKDKKTKQNFDWQNKIETGNRGESNWTLPLDTIVFDRMSHILQLRADLMANQNKLSYLISYKGKRKNYEYVIEKKENIKTKQGEYLAVKLVRTKNADKRLSIWMVPELDYFPVKIAQLETDKPDIVMTLNDVEFITTQTTTSQK